MADKVGAVYVEIGAMMASFDKAIAEAKVKAQALDKNLVGVKESVSRVDTASSRAASTMMMYGTVLVGVTAAIGAATIGWNAFIKPAMMAQEAVSKFNTIFGAESQQVTEWADRMGEAMARSSMELRSMAADAMALISPMSGSRDAAIQMSEGLVQMAQDLSSFHNVDVGEAFTALRSGISGETEPMKRFGIILTDAALAEYALAQGIRKKIEDMTTAEKAQLRYNAMLANMGAAQGDAERTSGSLTNQLRALGGTIKDIQVQIGSGAIDGITDFTRGLNMYLQEGDQFTQFLVNAAKAIGDMTGTLGRNMEAEVMISRLLKTRAELGYDIYNTESQSADLQDEEVRLTQALSTALGRNIEQYDYAQQAVDLYEETLIQRYGSIQNATTHTADEQVTAYTRLRDEMRRLSDTARQSFGWNLTDGWFTNIANGAGTVRNVLDSLSRGMQQQQQQLTRAQAAYNAWLQQAKAAREKYTQMIEESGATELEMAVVQYRRERDELIQSYNKRQIDQQTFNDAMIALDQQRAAKMEEIRQKESQQTASYAMTLLSTVGGMVSQLGNLFSMYYSNRAAEVDNNLQVETDALDEKYAADQARINSEITDSAAKAAALKALDEQYARDKKALEDKAAKDKAKLEREAAKRQKALSIADVLITTPAAAMQAFRAIVMPRQPWTYPLGIAAAAATTALGLAKLKLIMDTPLPEAASGIYAESPYIGGEAGPELAFPLSSERGRAAIALLAEGVVNAASGSSLAAPREATTTESGERTAMIQNTIYLDGAVIHESVSRATFDGRLLVASRAVV